MFVQYVHLPPAVYLPRMWAIPTHYGDNYLHLYSYNSSYYSEMATYVHVHHGKMDLFILRERNKASVDGGGGGAEPLVCHFSCDCIEI